MEAPASPHSRVRNCYDSGLSRGVQRGCHAPPSPDSQFYPPRRSRKARMATGTGRGLPNSLLVSLQQDWRGSEDQALQPVRQQAQLCVRTGLVKPVDDVLDNPAIRPGRYHQLLCCVVVRHRFVTYRHLFFSWHLRFVSMGPPHESHFTRHNLGPM